MDDPFMSQAQLSLVQAPFIASAELWSGEEQTPAPSVGLFVAERLWNTLEAAILVLPSASGQNASAVLSIPWYVKGTRCASLLVSNATAGGTFETWHADPERNELRLSSGYFGKWDEFKRVTALTRFPSGQGLPGRVWQTQSPVLLENLNESSAFLRAEAARSVGLQCGLGLPVHYATGMGVVVFLSSNHSPLGRSIDLWRLDAKSQLEHLQGVNFATSAREHALILAAAQRLALDSATQFLPTVLGPEAKTLSHSSLQSGFAWPSIDDDGCVHVATVVG